MQIQAPNQSEPACTCAYGGGPGLTVSHHARSEEEGCRELTLSMGEL